MFRLRHLALLLCCAASAPALHAEQISYPVKPVRFVVPLGPGSGADSQTRALADAFQKVAGQPAIVENKPGADLALGTRAALAEPADGHTILLITPSAMVVNPLLMPDLAYRTEDIRPLLHLSNNIAVLVTAAGSTFQSLGDVVERLRKEPGSVSLAVYGNTYRFGALAFQQQAGVRFNDIPYQGFGPAINDVIGGMTDVGLADLGGALPLIRSGKLRALAVGSAERVADAPDVPTFQEAGYPDYTLRVFVGYAVRSDTPEPVAQRVESLLREAASSASVTDMLGKLPGLENVSGPGAEFAAHIETENLRYRPLAEQMKAAAKP